MAVKSEQAELTEWIQWHALIAEARAVGLTVQEVREFIHTKEDEENER